MNIPRLNKGDGEGKNSQDGIPRHAGASGGAGKQEPSKNAFIDKMPPAVDDSIIYFVLMIFGISTGEVLSSDLLKTAGSAGYSYYSKVVMEIYNLGVKWQYGLARACEIVSLKVKIAEFKLFLMKMAQVIRLGDDLRSFFKHELDAIMNAYTAAYDRSMKSQEMLLGMYSTMMSTSAFMVAAVLIMMTLAGGSGGDNSQMVIGIIFAVVGGLGTFAFLMYKMFPKDKIHYDVDKTHTSKLRRWVLIAVGMSVGICAVLLISGILPPSLSISVAGVPLLIPGLLARKMESNIRKVDDYYPSFVRHLGDVYSTVGSLGQALKSVLRSDFGMLGMHVQAMHNRIMSRVTIEDSFEMLSRDTGSSIISAGNKVLANSMNKGASMSELGSVLADITSKILEMRKRRQQAAKAFESTTLIMHILTLAVFGLINKLLMFTNQLFSLQTSTFQMQNAPTLISTVDPVLMMAVMTMMAIALAGINALVVKVSQGGFFHTIWLNAGILLLIGGIMSFGVDQFLSQMLGGIINIDQIGSATGSG